MKLTLALPYAKGARCDTCGRLTIVHQYEARYDSGSTVTLMCGQCVENWLWAQYGLVAPHDQEEAAELDWLARAQRLGEGRLVDGVLELLARNGIEAREWEGDVNGGEC